MMIMIDKKKNVKTDVMKRGNGSQFAPCIIAKVRDAFFGTNNFNRNTKLCSKIYWDEACDKLGVLLNISNAEISNAKGKFSLYN